VIKRTLDLASACLGLIALSPVLVLIAVLIRMDSPGPILFRQQRVGKLFKPFTIYKFRTMRNTSAGDGKLITVDGDSRITRVGRVLRKYKLDELPQLFNVVVGDMSVVGPRPEVERYVTMFRADYEEILRVRPGLTDLASLEYRNESEVLATFADLEEGYIHHVLPRKLSLAKEYVRRSSVTLDFMLIARTLTSLFS